jgi:lipopolysaccharide cholinephosphotransferase
MSLENTTIELSHQNRIKLLTEITPFLDKFYPNWFLTMGSALGVIREQRLLPWDDDIDSGIIESDFIDSNISELQFQLEKIGISFKLWEENNAVKMNFRKYGEKMCFVVLYLSDDRTWYYRPSYRFPSKFFRQFKKINVHGVGVRVPSLSEDYLTFIYGKDWKTPIKNCSDRSLYNAKLYRRYSFLKGILRLMYKIMGK